MAQKTVLISDLTGEEVVSPARVTISFPDGKQGVVVIDADASEVEELVQKGRRQKRRGRQKAAAAA